MSNQERYAIHQAAREGKEITFEALLSTDPALAKLRDEDGRLPIHWAASSNQASMILLLAQGRFFDADSEDSSGWTPLMIASSLKEGEAVVEMLLQRGADINHKNHSGQTALHLVASKSNLDLARKLLDLKPNPASTRVRDNRGQYPIHRAAAVGSAPMVDLLIKYKSPLNAVDSYGQTPLHHAVAEGHGDTAITLLKAGAAADKKDSEGHLALDLAPDKEVIPLDSSLVRRYIERTAEREGIELE